jgi:CheY-like chemotaxis protein
MKKIGILTKSSMYAPLITGLKKRSKNVEQLNLDAKLEQYDTLLIDLAYPLDQAYTVLQKMRDDYRFSETIIFAIISHKSQLTKLRSFVFGVDGYISPIITPEELIEKLNEAYDPERHLASKKLNNIPLEIQTEGSLTHITESGAIIKSRIAFEITSKFTLSSTFFNELGINERLRCSITKSNPMAKRSFISEVNFLNLTDLNRDKIRSMIKTWGS